MFVLILDINVPELFFDFCCDQTVPNFGKFEIAFYSCHISILFPVLHLNM